ncbi:hypothetical protein [Novosphingobium sp. 9]|uniref:hypothetical protein n=1 Tax=Novosphingobium sp. 9 TaxID=2025349 RepID=UPI0021B5BD55|nr:hypothetical protein [Novosphingobium sp. 9]
MSYGLYAVHWGLMGLFRHFKDDLGYDPVLMAIVYLGAGILLAWCASRWVDQPARAWLSRRRRSKLASEGPATVSHRPS